MTVRQANLSVIIITRNEERDLPSCLASVAGLAGEIVVVDSGSTDKTLEIAKSSGAQVFHHEWTGYSAQKQFALDKAKGPWVLNLDADEKLSPALKDEIARVVENPGGTVAFDIPFHHYFLGKHLRFGSGRGETHIRLFRKDAARYGTEAVHEGIVVNGAVGRLKNHIDHVSYRDLSEYLTKCNVYTSMIAREKWKKGKRFSIFHHLRLPYEFVVRYFFKLGFLDGEAGLTYALLSSYYVWLKFAKLRDVQENQ